MSPATNMRNLLQTISMLTAMTALLAMIGFVLAGWDGLIITATFTFMFLVFGRSMSKTWMLKGIGAMKLPVDQAPVLHKILEELSRRAGLSRVPELYLLDADMMLGFSTGGGENDAAIVLTGPLVQGLSAREIAAVLAHEVSHIASGDLAVLGMADLVTRMTRTLSFVGVILFIFNIPMAASGGSHLPWGALALLLMAPLMSFLIQMALSRAREFEADLGALNISGEPEALARALEKLEYQQKGLLRYMFMPHQPGTEPSLLRSHPVTTERVRRILAHGAPIQPLPDELVGEHHGYPRDWPAPLGMPVRWLLRWWR